MKHHKTPFLSLVMSYALPSIQYKILQFLHLWFLHEIGQAAPCTIYPSGTLFRIKSDPLPYNNLVLRGRLRFRKNGHPNSCRGYQQTYKRQGEPET